MIINYSPFLDAIEVCRIQKNESHSALGHVEA